MYQLPSRHVRACEFAHVWAMAFDGRRAFLFVIDADEV